MSQASLPALVPPALDLNDVQGDIILGIPKRFEDFIFFQINNVADFKRDLKELIPAITTTAQVVKTRQDIADHKAKGHHGLFKLSAINIAFSFQGLTKLGITDKLGDDDFEAGQLAHAQALGDPGTTTNGTFDPDWLPAFKGETDGLILIAGDCKLSVDESAYVVEHIFGNAIKVVLKVSGNVRPGKEKGHEHFGFLDGISSPAIAAITPPLPGQQVVDPGVVLLGQTGDSATRPDWAKNGSFLAYRQLNQLVPEFDKFLTDNPIVLPGLPRDKGSELLGARLIGRWKSGAPIDIVPTQDDPALAADPQKNNNFDFSKVADQTNCPFAAHIRKTNPRSDLAKFPGAVATHSIIRAGIPFGPEVTHDEAHTGKTHHTRGLAFVCYQSTLANGFEFLQEAWANTEAFPPFKPVTPGFDPIIGQNGKDPHRVRELAGTNPSAQGIDISLPIDFVVSKGGAYFFSPSISALKTKFTA